MVPYGLELPSNRAQRYAAAHCWECDAQDDLTLLPDGQFRCLDRKHRKYPFLADMVYAARPSWIEEVSIP